MAGDMGHLEVCLMRAEDLKNVESKLFRMLNQKQDPYCILSVGGRSVRSGTHTDGGTAPVWNQMFTWPDVCGDDTLTIDIYDENVASKDVCIGSAKTKLKQVVSLGSMDMRLPLTMAKGKQQGFVVLRGIYRRGSMAPTAVGVVTVNPSNTAAFKQAPPRPTSGYRPGLHILPTYKCKDAWETYKKGHVLGQGSYGTTYLATEHSTGKQVAIKEISKRRLATPAEVEDVQREVQIMHHLQGHPHVVQLIRVHEDKASVLLVMELCTGGELFDSIIARGRFTEKDAATVMRTIMSVVAHCHNMGVVHRDLKPENFLLADKSPEAVLKATDFGLSAFFQEGQVLTDMVGSAFYVAPEVLRRSYGKEADIWSCGVILYILLCGTPPFNGETEKKIFQELVHKPLDLQSPPWDRISEPAKDCVRRMLARDPRQRATAAEVLKHDWMRENGVATDNPIQLEVLTRIKNFAGMNQLKKEALRVIACNLPVDEISGLREMFMEMDKDRSGTITVDEFTAAIRRKGEMANQYDMARLMEAADMNGDGTLDYEEFLATFLAASKLEREENLIAAFEQFDVDGNGRLSVGEIMQALRQLKLSDTEIQKIMAEVDQDGDGCIDFNEFQLLMRAC